MASVDGLWDMTFHNMHYAILSGAWSDAAPTADRAGPIPEGARPIPEGALPILEGAHWHLAWRA